MLCPLTRRNRYLGSVPFAPHLPEFTAPLATSTSESGLPGVTTPGTFHPSVFATVRRFTPPISCLFYFTQAPPMGFKEQADLLSLKTDGSRRTLQTSSASFETRSRPNSGRSYILTCCFPRSSFPRRPSCQRQRLPGQAQTPIASDEASPSRGSSQATKTSNRLTQTAVPRIDSL